MDVLSYTPYLALGGIGLALFFVIRSVRFTDDRTEKAVASLEKRAIDAEASVASERHFRIAAEMRAGVAEVARAALEQKIADLTEQVVALRAEVERLRKELHGAA